MSVKTQRNFFWIGLFALTILAGFIWRLPLLEKEKKLIWYNNDTTYQYNLIKKSIYTYPLIPTFDSFSHFPNGYRIHWLPIHTFFYTSIVKGFGLRDSDPPESFQFLLSIIPPLLGIITFFLTICIARFYVQYRFGILIIGIFSSFLSIRYNPFFYGQIDHHLFSHLGIMIVILARFTKKPILWATGLSVAFFMAPAAPFYITFIILAIFISDIVKKNLKNKTILKLSIWYLLPGIICFLSLILNRIIEVDPQPLLKIDLGYLSLFHVLWFLFLGIFIESVILLKNKSFQSRKKFFLIMGFMAIGIFCAIFFFSDHLKMILERLSRSGRMVVSEERSLLANGLFNASPWIHLYCLACLYYLIRLIRCVFSGKSGEECLKWSILTVLFIIGLLENRHMLVLSNILLIGVVATGFQLCFWFYTYLNLSSRKFIFLPYFFIGLITISAFFFEHIHPRSNFLDTHCKEFALKQKVVSWLKKNTPQPLAGGSDQPKYGIFAPWDYGHQINVFAQRPVVVDPFNFPISIERELKSVWWAKSGNELIQNLIKLEAKFLVVTDPGMQIVNLMNHKEISKKNLLSKPIEGNLYYRSNIMKYAIIRLFLNQGQNNEFNRLIPRYLSEQKGLFPILKSDNIFANFPVSEVQIFELKKQLD